MNVYLSETIDSCAYERLATRCQIITTLDHPETLDAIIVRRAIITRETIAQAKSCKIIAMHGVGLDTIDMKAANEYNIPVVNIPDGSTETVAELAVAFILSLSRKLKQAGQGLAEGRYKSFGPSDLIGTEIYEKKLGVIGLGRISKRIGEIMKQAFHCELYVYDPYVDSENAKILGYTKLNTPEALFHLCDIVSVSVPLTDSTRNLINGKTFEHANPNLILINTARGGIIDEDALYYALANQQIYAAGMDVSIKEPMDQDNPLLKLENFIITPHIGGSTVEAKRRNGTTVVNNVFKACKIEE